MLDEKRYSEAVKALGEVLASPEDGVLPASPEEPTRFLKAEAGRLIATMPAEGREAYQREYAAQSQRLLEAAIKEGNLAGIEHVAGQFFHTPSGYTATQLLANIHLDHGRALAAALCLERLREAAGATLKTQQIIKALADRDLLSSRRDPRRVIVRWVPKIGRVDAYALKRAEFGRRSASAEGRPEEGLL